MLYSDVCREVIVIHRLKNQFISKILVSVKIEILKFALQSSIMLFSIKIFAVTQVFGLRKVETFDLYFMSWGYRFCIDHGRAKRDSQEPNNSFKRFLFNFSAVTT